MYQLTANNNEQSLHDLKQKGCLIVLSHSNSSIDIWTSRSHRGSQVWGNFETSNGINFTEDLTSCAIAKSKPSTSFLIYEFCPSANSAQNSFDVCGMSLQNIVTGFILSDNNSDQLVNSRDISLNEMKIFVKE